MKLSYDPAKDARNAQERGLSFERVYEFDFDTAIIRPDLRFAYPEPRFVATGFIGERLLVVCYTPAVDGIRIISLRKANARELARYEKEKS